MSLQAGTKGLATPADVAGAVSVLEAAGFLSAAPDTLSAAMTALTGRVCELHHAHRSLAKVGASARGAGRLAEANHLAEVRNLLGRFLDDVMTGKVMLLDPEILAPGTTAATATIARTHPVAAARDATPAPPFLRVLDGGRE